MRDRMKPLGLFLILSLTGCPENPSDKKKDADAAPVASQAAPVKPLINVPKAADWCKEHGVPESQCTRCNASLIAGHKAKGDWCAKHELPDSQCIACHPELEAKLKAMEPK